MIICRAGNRISACLRRQELLLASEQSKTGDIMQRIKITVGGLLGALSLLWLAAEPSVFQPAGFFALRSAMMQYSGILAIGCMSAGMMLALRPRWPEKWFGGLDKMYRLHKWLGIGALAIGVIHYLWAKGPKWAVGFGLLERPQRGPRPVPDTAIEQTLSSMRPLAETVGEWAFYATAALGDAHRGGHGAPARFRLLGGFGGPIPRRGSRPLGSGRD